MPIMLYWYRRLVKLNITRREKQILLSNLLTQKRDQVVHLETQPRSQDLYPGNEFGWNRRKYVLPPGVK